MGNDRRIKARTLVLDIRSGVPKSQLLKKHLLSAQGLDKLLHKLLAHNLLTEADIDSWELSNHDVTIVRGIRQTRRRRIEFALRIQDADYPYAVGTVRDISENGLKVEGIVVSVGDCKKLVLHSCEGFDFNTAFFQAQCRWVNQGGSLNGTCLAGLEITEIDREALSELRKLLKD